MRDARGPRPLPAGGSGRRGGLWKAACPNAASVPDAPHTNPQTTSMRAESSQRRSHKGDIRCVTTVSLGQAPPAARGRPLDPSGRSTMGLSEHSRAGESAPSVQFPLTGFPPVVPPHVPATRQTDPLRNRQAAPLETRLEHGRQRLAFGPPASSGAEARPGLPAVPLHLRHQAPATSAARGAGSTSPPNSRSSIRPGALHRLITRSQSRWETSSSASCGGEPFMHPHAARHARRASRTCYFQIFTNGHFITDERGEANPPPRERHPAHQRRGSEIVCDERRGRTDVLEQDDAGDPATASKHKVFTGVCTSVCKTNIDDLVTDKWVDRLIEMGVLYTWFHVYRPMGPTPARTCASRRTSSSASASSSSRSGRKPIIIVDAYHDHAGEAPVPGRDRHHAPHQPVGRHRAVPDRAVRRPTRSTIRRSPSPSRLDSPFLKDFRELGAGHDAAASSSNVPTCCGISS